MMGAGAPVKGKEADGWNGRSRSLNLNDRGQLGGTIVVLSGVQDCRLRRRPRWRAGYYLFAWLGHDECGMCSRGWKVGSRLVLSLGGEADVYLEMTREVGRTG